MLSGRLGSVVRQWDDLHRLAGRRHRHRFRLLIHLHINAISAVHFRGAARVCAECRELGGGLVQVDIPHQNARACITQLDDLWTLS